MKHNKPSAVIFDTDNTLYEYNFAHSKANNAVITKAETILGINKNLFIKALDSSKKEIKSRLGDTASSHNRLLYYQRAIEILGMKTQIFISLDLEQTYWRTFLSHCKLFDGVVGFIKLLKMHNITTAIITDLTAQIQFRKIVYFGLDDLFDYIVTSEESGYDKPHKVSFELALDKINTSGAIWMIGDSCNADMIGASEFNMIKMQKIHKGVKKCNQADFFIHNYDDFISKIKW
jgi:putative hydrolase of the HAD superfamily